MLNIREFEIFVFGANQEQLRPLSEREGSRNLQVLVEENMEDGILEWVMTGDEIRVIAENEMLSSDLHAGDDTSFVYVPLNVDRKRTGLLLIHTEVEKAAISRQKLELLKLIAGQIAAAIEKIQVKIKLRESVRIVEAFKKLSEEAEAAIAARDW